MGGCRHIGPSRCHGGLADYNGDMARGWESKSVEQQQEEASHGKDKSKAPMSAEQIAVERQRTGIELSPQHILQQLQVPCNARHRQMLEHELADFAPQLGNVLKSTGRIRR